VHGEGAQFVGVVVSVMSSESVEGGNNSAAAFRSEVSVYATPTEVGSFGSHVSLWTDRSARSNKIRAISIIQKDWVPIPSITPL
jgi:hypothetical protein